MSEFLLLMHNDGALAVQDGAWPRYIASLNALGVLRGGSSIGPGICVKRSGNGPGINSQLTGYIKIEATDLAHARELVQGNPTFEAGGTVEIRELPVTE